MNVRTQYYNTAPRGVQTGDSEATKARLTRLAEQEGKTEDQDLSYRVRVRAANEVLNSLDLYA